MAITLNPAGVVCAGLGVCNITYINGAAVTQTAVTGTGGITIGGDISPFADQAPVTANGTIITYLSKNPGTRYNFKCYIIGGGTAILAAPPAINTRIDFDWFTAGTDLNGIVKSSKVALSDDVAILDVEIDVVAGLTFVAGP
jgi:hypothetical protein